MTAKRYFELTDATSNKFWEVWRDGAEVFTRYGKIGAQGQITVKDMKTDAEGGKLLDKLVREKTGKGYVEKTGGKAKPAAAAAPAKPAKVAAKKPAAAAKPAAGAKPAVAAKPAAAAAKPVAVEVPKGAIRLEVVEGNSAKFWQIQQIDKKLIVTFGKIGTAGTVQEKKYKEEWEARHQRDRQVSEKKRKGYQPIILGEPPKTPTTVASNPELEAQILKDPSSDDGYIVYADWLQQQGDARGDLAALQVQLAADPKAKPAKQAEAKLLWEHRAHFYGPLAPYVSKKPDENAAIEATWRHGWIDSLALSAINVWSRSDEDPTPSVDNVAELVRALPKVASAKFLRELVLAKPVSEDEYDFGQGLKALANVELPALRRLTIGRFSYEDSELSWSHLGNFEPLWERLPGLEYLKLRVGSMTLGKISAPNLRELRIETGGFDKKSLASVTSASWPKLETLNIWFGQDSYGCNCKPADTAPILAGIKFPKLVHLGLANSTWGNELAPLIARSKILPQLQSLDLSMSHLTDAGMQVLAQHKDAFANLQSLDVSRCLLGKEGVRIAKTLAKTVNVERQNDPSEYENEDDDDYRYSAVGE